MNPDLQKYLLDSRQAGKTNDQISQELRGAGWSEVDISKALGISSQNSIVPPPPIDTLATSGIKTVSVGVYSLLALSVFVGVFFIFFYKQPTGSKSSSESSMVNQVGTTKYTMSNGIFSVIYPTEWSPTELTAGALKFSMNSTSNDLKSSFPDSFTIGVGEKSEVEQYYTSDIIKKTLKVSNIENTKFSGYDAQKFTVGTKPNDNTIYIAEIPNQEYDLLISYHSSDPSVIEKIEKTINTIKVDNTKLSIVKEQNQIYKDTVIAKNILSVLRAEGELYYDNNSGNGYSGLCTMKGNYKKSFDKLKVYIGNNFKCTDSETEYVLSAKLPNGEYWCSDSTGFFAKVSGYQTSKQCPDKIQ